MVPLVSRRLPWRCVCLEQALGARRILRWIGVDSRLQLGVAKDGEKFAAHAWLEVSGRIFVGGAQSRRFHVFKGDGLV